MLEERRKQLYEMYQVWEKELKDACPQLITKEYSHPYYLHIPDEWFETKIRILIVGEEGYGPKLHDITIEEAQAFNRLYLAEQLGSGKKNSSAFWRRIRRIATILDSSDFSITWTNLDKIHRSGTGNCRLKKEDRLALHKTPTCILREEIKLLNPTHIIYFGWYRDSLAAELQDELQPVFDALYPNGSPVWDSKKMKTIPENSMADTYHIFTYHPGWGQRQKNYEDNVLDEIKEAIEKINNY